MPTINHNFDVTIDVNDVRNRHNTDPSISSNKGNNNRTTEHRTEQATIRISGTCSTEMSMDMLPQMAALFSSLIGSVAAAKRSLR